MSKCPPGVICVENISFVLLFIILVILGIFIYANMSPTSTSIVKTNIEETNIKETNIMNRLNPFFQSNDVLQNPYIAPQRDNYFMSLSVPMQTNRNAVDIAYNQIGIMTPLNGASKDNILPLMGRPLFTSRSKWQYYAISNQHNNVKLPISFKGKNALTDYGVDEIFSGDTVYVEGYNEPFKTTVYENSTMKYLPF